MRTLGAGSSSLLSFQFSGDGPFAYQWRRNGSPLSGATQLTLGLSNVAAAQAGLYDVVVTGPGGAVTTAPALVALFGSVWALSSGQRLPLLVLDGPSGVGYRLEYSWNLSPTNWNLLTPVTPQGSRLYYVDELDTNYFRRFYRAVPQ